MLEAQLAKIKLEKENQRIADRLRGTTSAQLPGLAQENATVPIASSQEEAAAKAKEEEAKRKEALLSKGAPVTIQVTVNSEQISLSGKRNYIFVDVFEYIDFDLSKPQGSGIVTTLNGREAQYMEKIKSGDVIEIYWKD